MSMNSRAASFLLAVDVGNSRVKLGVFDRREDRAPGALPTCLHAVAVACPDPLPWSEIVVCLAGAIEAVECVIAGANPTGIRRVLADWPTGWIPLPRHIETPDGFP
ncbi:MAG: hypothetical protein ACREJB_18425, partial [Planctomycetaceae bacterium]